MPITIGGYFSCTHNNLTTLEGSPITVRASFYCYGNKLTNLRKLPKNIGEECMVPYSPNLPLLQLIMNDIGSISFYPHIDNDISDIINKWINEKKSGILAHNAAQQCGIELINTGFAGNAKI